jgi:two-component system cell cycle sensor histidine kinase/response regulator CckA
MQQAITVERFALAGSGPAVRQERAPWFSRWLGVAVALFSLAVGAFAAISQTSLPLWMRIAILLAVAGPVGFAASLLFCSRKTASLLPAAAGSAQQGLLQAASDAIEEPLAVLGPGGQIVHANAAFRSLAGDFIPALLGDDAKQGIAFTRAVTEARGGHSTSFQFLLGAASADFGVRRLCAAPVPSYEGHVLVRVQDEIPPPVLAGTRETLVSIAASVGLGYYEVDAEGRILFANDVFAGWLGIAKIELARGAITFRRILKDRTLAVTTSFDPFGGTTGEGSGTLIFRRSDGSEVSLLVAQRAASAGSIVAAHGIARPAITTGGSDSTFDHPMQQLFHNAPIGLAILDAAGGVRRANPAFRDLLGAAGDETVRLGDLLSEESRERFEDQLRAPGARAGAPIDISARHRSGRVLAASIAALERTDSGAEPLFVMYCLDATDQRQFQTQMTQAQKMQAVGQLAGGIAHDFNNLLTAMIGYCDLLLQRHRPGEQSFADIMQIKQNANRAAGLVRQLLAFSRQQTLKPKVLKITDVLTDLTHLLRRLVGANIALTVQHSRELGFVRVDQGYFEQVIINLVVNARDAMPEGGDIRIETKVMKQETPLARGAETIPAGEYVRIDVIDRGTGIAPENLGRIFDPFFTTKELGQGTGLGLSTVYGIVKQTGGYVLVESVLNEGSIFTILLPRHHPVEQFEREAAPLAEAPRDLTGAGTILLVEDEDPVRAFSARALRNKGYKVIEARTGIEALEVFQRGEQSIDLVVTDVMMPHMDGPSLIKRVREKRPDIRIICISGYAEESFRDKIGAWDDIRFLAKPYSLNQLAGMVKDAFGAVARQHA